MTDDFPDPKNGQFFNFINYTERRQFVALTPKPPLYQRDGLKLPNFSILFCMMEHIIEKIKISEQILIEECEIPIDLKTLKHDEFCKMIFTRKKEYVDEDHWRVTCNINSEKETSIVKTILSAYNEDKEKEENDEKYLNDWFKKRIAGQDSFSIHIKEL